MKVIFTKINTKYIPEYCLITKIVQDESGARRVIKTPFDHRALQHLLGLKIASQELPDVFSTMKICPCDLGDNEASFDYIEGETYLSRLKTAASGPVANYHAAWREFMALLNPVNTVAFREMEASVALFGDMAEFIGAASYPKCALDLTPSNVMVSDNDKPTLIDYEWWVNAPVPVELIKYHALYITWQFHPEIRHNQVTFEALLGECGFDEASLKRCSHAVQHFYSHIGGTSVAQKPYYLSLPRYVKETIPVGSLGLENRMLKQQNAQLFQQMDAERKVREDMLAGWREASRCVDKLHELLSRNGEEYAKERAETRRQIQELSQSLIVRNESFDELKRRYGELEQQYSELNRCHEISVSEWTATAERYRQSEAQRLNAEEQVRMLQTSRSWRLTRPLRDSKTAIKRAIGKSVISAYHFIKRKKDKPIEKAAAPNWPPQEARKASGAAESLDAKAKRIAVYHFFDKDGHVDRYVLHFLRELSKVTQKIVFVSNGPLREGDEEKVKEYAHEILIRNNSGFDAWGMKAGIEHIGKSGLSHYDELLLLNSTFFGPVSDMRDVFDGMASRNVDFWGMASHPGFDYDPFNCNPYGCVPAHVQTYWVGIRKRMFEGDAFWKFWKELPEIKNYDQAVGMYETVFTRYFSDLGYTWDTWMNPKDYTDLTDNPLIATPIEAVRDMHCPIIKWRAFFQDYDYLTSFTAQHTASFLMDYIRDSLDYPEDYVWEYLIRTRHMSELTQNMHLAEILDKNSYSGPSIEQYVSKHPVALFMHLFDEKMADEMAIYAARMPENAHIWISTTSEEKKERIQQAFRNINQKVFIRVCENRGRDVSALLASFSKEVMNYEIICVTHDKKTAHLHPETVGEGFAYEGYENILASKEYVSNIIQAFENNPRLGLLYSPDPNHADFVTHIGLEWGNNFGACKNLADELGLNVPMDSRHPACAPYGSNFWIRTSALRPLYKKNWTYDDFPKEPLREMDGTIMHAVERIYPYCAQEAGYYSALAMTTEHSSIELGNLEFYAQTYAHVCFENGIENRYITVRDILDQSLGSVPVVPETPQQVERIAATTSRFVQFKQRVSKKLTMWASQ